MGVAKPRSAEINPGPGFRVRTECTRVAPEVVAALGRYETPDISDLMNRLYTMVADIRPMTGPNLPILGTAITVKTYPGDNLMVHKALDVAKPGDVIVVDTGGARRTAVLGDLVSAKARHRGIGGFVVDGLIRDLPGILELKDLPVFARGVTPVGPLHRGPGEINYPVAVGGIVVQPGDAIVGDLNGVVVVPKDSAPEILQRLEDHAEANASYTAAVARGEFSNAWVDKLLADNGLTPE
jgi:RraA family protein